MIRRVSCLLVLAAALASASVPAAPAGGATIPAHPDQLAYEPLAYEAPNRDRFRHRLGNGVTVFVIEDHGLPLVDVRVTVRGGQYLEPAGKECLSAMTADQMRSGGAGDMDADAFDQRVDFLAVNMGFGSDRRESSGSMNCLSKDLDAALDLFFAAMRSPRFQQDRIDLYKTQVKQQLERRNDSTTDIELREWRRLFYGADHFEAKQATAASIDAITREDLVAFHARVWNPSNLILAVSGDVKPAEVLARLEKRFAGWEKGPSSPEAPKPEAKPVPGVFVVNKDDVNQSRVSLGHLATTWDDPRRPSLEVMNEVLGGGGFASRILKRVRSDEGLAYSAGSGISFGRNYPMSFRAAFQSKNESVAQAIDITLNEIERMRSETVSKDELDLAKSSIIESFPQRFSSADAKAMIFLEDEVYGRPADYWEKYRPSIQAVTSESVLESSKSFLHPDQLTILVVGKVDEVLKGDPDRPDHSLAKTAAKTGVQQIPLPDPSSLTYPSPPATIVPPGGQPQPATPAGD